MEVCQPRHFGSHPPSCMRILRPVIGLVEGAWWGDRLLLGGLEVCGCALVTSQVCFSDPVGKATGAQRCSAVI